MSNENSSLYFGTKISGRIRTQFRTFRDSGSGSGQKRFALRHFVTLPLKVQPINYEDVQKVVLFSRDLLNREPIINVRERMNFLII